VAAAVPPAFVPTVSSETGHPTQTAAALRRTFTNQPLEHSETVDMCMIGEATAAKPDIQGKLEAYSAPLVIAPLAFDRPRKRNLTALAF
jgi:acetylglutamate kinase